MQKINIHFIERHFGAHFKGNGHLTQELTAYR